MAIALTEIVLYAVVSVGRGFRFWSICSILRAETTKFRYTHDAQFVSVRKSDKFI